jgi:hypothetical protein
MEFSKYHAREFLFGYLETPPQGFIVGDKNVLNSQVEERPILSVQLFHPKYRVKMGGQLCLKVHPKNKLLARARFPLA